MMMCYIENPTLVVISYERNTIVRFSLSYDHFNGFYLYQNEYYFMKNYIVVPDVNMTLLIPTKVM